MLKTFEMCETDFVKLKKIHSEKRARLNQRLARATGIKTNAKGSKPMPTTNPLREKQWLRAVYWVLIGRPPSCCSGHWLRYSLFFSISAQTCIKRKKSHDGVERCLLWVKSRHNAPKSPCPLYPGKRTFVRTSGMSAKCQ